MASPGAGELEIGSAVSRGPLDPLSCAGTPSGTLCGREQQSKGPGVCTLHARTSLSAPLLNRLALGASQPEVQIPRCSVTLDRLLSISKQVPSSLKWGQ